MKKNPYLHPGRIGDAGREAEKQAARRLKGRSTVGSGNIAGDKGDLELGEFLIEVKSTVADSMKLDRGWLAKVSGEAAMKGRRPALTVLFVRPDGTLREDGAWVLVPERVFKEMT